MAKASAPAEGSALTAKYIIIGDQNCGKSCLLLQFTDGKFMDQHNVTIGVEFGTRTVEVDGQCLKIQAWDTAGQETFRSITRNYFRNTACALVVYDITRRDTFRHVDAWITECQESAGNENIIIVLIGNKVDKDRKRKVSRKEGESLAKQHGILFREVSAKECIGVDEVFESTAKLILNSVDEGKVDVTNRASGVTFDVPNHSAPGTKRGCCG